MHTLFQSKSPFRSKDQEPLSNRTDHNDSNNSASLFSKALNKRPTIPKFK